MNNLLPCQDKDVNPDIFNYPEQGLNKKTLPIIYLAQDICQECPVKSECLKQGMSNGDYSFRGGQLLKNGIPQHVPTRTGTSNGSNYLSAYLSVNAGKTCEKGHPRTKETVRPMVRGGRHEIHCVPCLEAKVFGHDFYTNTYDQCSRRKHWLVPDNLTDEGDCLRCDKWFGSRRGGRPKKTHCPKNHPYSGDNVYWATRDGKKIPSCRICRRDSERRRQSYKTAKRSLERALKRELKTA